MEALSDYEPRLAVTENSCQAIEVGRSVFLSEGALAAGLAKADIARDDYAVLRILPL